MSSMKALLMGYYGMGNLGDEMMLFCLRPWLEQQDFELTVLSERPDDVVQRYGLRSVENCPLMGEWAWCSSWMKGRAWRVISAIAGCDAFIVGGGDLIRDDLGWRTFFYTIEKLILAILLSKKIYVVNAGIGRPSTRYGRIILRWVLGRCDRIIVRDLRSEILCAEIGASPRTALAPDIVLSLPNVITNGPGTFAGLPTQNAYVTVCLRHDANAFQSFEMTEERVRTLAGSLDDLIERRDVDVVFLPFQANPENGLADTQLHERVAEAMVHTHRIHVRPWTANLDEVCSTIREARFVVAMRLHAAILALSYGRPSVLMPYDRKIREFGDLMNISHRIEATTLNDRSSVGSVLEDAWLDAQNELKMDAPATNVSSIWGALALESA